MNLKIVLLGNSGVGKTSVAFRWTTGTWQNSIQATIGANHQRKMVHLENQDVDVYVWDTAGQEQFQALTPLYARSSSCAIIMTSIDDISSFNSLPTWTELLQTSCENTPPAILVVNKVDKSDDKCMTREEIETQFGNKFETIMYASAMTGEGVDDLFVLAADLGLKFVKTHSEKTKTLEVKEEKTCC